MPTHRTLAGDELVYPEPSGALARYLGRVREAAADPGVGVGALVDLIYSDRNPLLGPGSSPALAGRGTATAATWADPTWHVMLDLLEAKRVQEAEAAPSLRLSEAAERLELTEDAVRKAVLAGTLEGEKRANRWYVTPASVESYRRRVPGPGRRPSEALEVQCGRVPGYSLSVKAAETGPTNSVRRGIVAMTIPSYERVIVRLTGEDPKGGKLRRVLVLEPDLSVEPWTFHWPPDAETDPPLFVRGRFHVAERINSWAKAVEAWRALEPG